MYADLWFVGVHNTCIVLKCTRSTKWKEPILYIFTTEEALRNFIFTVTSLLSLLPLILLFLLFFYATYFSLCFFFFYFLFFINISIEFSLLLCCAAFLSFFRTWLGTWVGIIISIFRSVFSLCFLFLSLVRAFLFLFPLCSPFFFSFSFIFPINHFYNVLCMYTLEQNWEQIVTYSLRGHRNTFLMLFSRFYGRRRKQNELMNLKVSLEKVEEKTKRDISREG
uniref:Uncharacterized protein n=1 Tax=Cacopsylla melanoneura TaxID=428564 RepID=A0A8D8ZA12_9HEMI